MPQAEITRTCKINGFLSTLPLAVPYHTSTFSFSRIPHHKADINAMTKELVRALILPLCGAAGRQLGPFLLGTAEVLLGFNALIHQSFVDSSAYRVFLRLWKQPTKQWWHILGVGPPLLWPKHDLALVEPWRNDTTIWMTIGVWHCCLYLCLSCGWQQWCVIF